MKAPPKPLNAALTALFSSEKNLIGRIPFPYGVSIAALAKKKKMAHGGLRYKVLKFLLMRKEVKNWLDSAQYDLESAEYNFSGRRYIYTVFMCHLALEKVLKAKVEELTGKAPPKTHDLEYLVELSMLTLDPDKENFIGQITSSSVVTRYHQDFQRLYKDFSKDRTEKILHKTKEVFQWIKKFITP